MRIQTVQIIGLLLIATGFIAFIYLSLPQGNIEVIGYNLQQAFGLQTFPLSSATPEQKISPLLQQAISRALPGERIPVVIVLTAPKQMAVAQQQALLPRLQAYQFQLVSQTIYVANTMAGYVPADKVEDMASEEYIEKILYDGKIFRVSWDWPWSGNKVRVSNLQQSIQQIGADKAWQLGYTGQGVKVIIIDSGIANNHPALQRNGKSLVIYEESFVPGASDYTHWHGTHVAGIIASQDATYKGVAPGIEGFIDLIAFDSDGSASPSWLLKALDEAYRIVTSQPGTYVSSNSWGTDFVDAPEAEEMRMAAMNLADKIPVVFAAGNTGPGTSTIWAPGDADRNGNEVITVAAVDTSGNIATFSSRGPDTAGEEHNEPDVAAPGVNIMSTVPTGFEAASGTSMATPHVAGVIALMLSKNPSLSNRDCLRVLEQTASGGGFNYATGYGIVQADEAVQAASQTFITPTVPEWVYQAISIAIILVGIVLVLKPKLEVMGIW